MLLGERLDRRVPGSANALATSPLALEAQGRGVVVLFRYGVAVFFGVAALEEDDMKPGTIVFEILLARYEMFFKR